MSVFGLEPRQQTNNYLFRKHLDSLLLLFKKLYDYYDLFLFPDIRNSIDQFASNVMAFVPPLTA